MKTAPSAVVVTPSGAFSWAAAGGPPSPAAPGVPVPATLVIVPVASTRRMRLSPVSAMRKPPPMIGATLEGAFSEAWTAGPRSPSPSAWPPATVVMIPLVLTRRMRLLPVSAIRNEPSGRAATSRGAFSEAPVAASPSPPKPALADPATVVMTPVGLTRRMRLLPVSAMRKPPSAVGETPRGPFEPHRAVGRGQAVAREPAGRVARAGSGDGRDRAARR